MYGDASVAAILVYTSPVFVMLMSALAFKEKITWTKIVALVLTLAGCVLVSGILGGVGSVKFVIILAGVSSGFCYGMYTILSKFIMKKYSNKTINFYTFVFCVLGSLFFVNIKETAAVVFSSASVCIWAVLSGIVTCILPFFLYTLGLKNVAPSKASIVVAVDPVVATVVGVLFLGDDFSLSIVLGIILILSSIVILNTGVNSGEKK